MADSETGRLSAVVGMDWLGALFQLDLPVGRMLERATCSGGLRRPQHDVALNRHPVGSLDGPESGGYSHFASGDGLAVAPAVGALGQALAELLDLADVGLALVGVRGSREDGGIGGGGIQDEADRLALRVWALT